MKHSEFEQQHAWMCGLSEYFRVSDHNDDYELLFRALYHDNKYRKRDLLFEMHKRIETEKLWGGDANLKSFYNTALYSELEDYQVNPRTLIGMISWFCDDNLIDRVYKFLTYFVDREQEIPNLIDFFSRGQVKSKMWMVTELAQVVEGSLGNIVFYGGWYNFLAHFLFDQFDVNKITSIDIDETVIGPSKRLYSEELDDKRFHPFTADVNKMQWRDRELWYIDYDKRDEQIQEWMEAQEQTLSEKRQVLIDKFLEEKAEEIKQGLVDKDKAIESISADLRTELFKDKDKIFENYGWRRLDNFDMVVNTSCEHIDNTWFENLPQGSFVVLQTNDYFENEQHSNCCKDLEAAKEKYPMQNLFYEGELDTQLYNRFMLIGIK